MYSLISSMLNSVVTISMSRWVNTFKAPFPISAESKTLLSAASFFKGFEVIENFFFCDFFCGERSGNLMAKGGDKFFFELDGNLFGLAQREEAACDFTMIGDENKLPLFCVSGNPASESSYGRQFHVFLHYLKCTAWLKMCQQLCTHFLSSKPLALLL